MTEAYDQFEKLLRQLHEMDSESEEADIVRDQMDGPWYQMTDEERKQAQDLSEQLYKEKGE